MVQIVNMQPRPSISGAFGRGFEGGVEQGINAGISYKMQEMLEAKRQAITQDREGQKGLAALKLLVPHASDEEKQAAYFLGPQGVDSLIKQRGSNALKGLFSGLQEADQPETRMPAIRSESRMPQNRQMAPQEAHPQYQESMQQPQDPTINIQGIPNKQIPPMMVNYGAQPVQQEIAGPEYQEPVRRQEMEQAPRPKAPHEMTESEWATLKANTPNLTEDAIKRADSMRSQQIRNASMQSDIELKKRAIDLKENADRREEARFREEMGKTPEEVKPYLKEIAVKRSKVEANRGAFDVAERAIKSGDTSGFIQYFSNKYGFDPLISSNSALLNQTAKEIVQSSVQRAGQGGKNQWYEKMLKSMFPHPGQTQESALIGVHHLRFLDDIDRREVEIADRLEQEDREKYGRVRTDLPSRVSKELRPFYLEQREKFARDVQETLERNMSQEQINRMIKVDPGTPLTKRKAMAINKYVNGDREKTRELAIKLGYELPERK